MNARDFVSILQSAAADPPAPFRLGTIDPAYSSGNPKVIFDGESVASTRLYHYLTSYTPAANDRVLIALVNAGGVILGKISA